MKKYLWLTLIMLLISGAAVMADATMTYDGYTQDEFDTLTKTTVIHSDDAVTGYFVTFRYMNDTASKVEIKGEWNFTDMEHATIYTTANYCFGAIKLRSVKPRFDTPGTLSNIFAPNSTIKGEHL